MSCRNSKFVRRSGLAPLELVLSIPLIMFAVSLSVVIGTAACWKVRASVVARNEIWSLRWSRYQTPSDPRPSGWPTSAGRGLGNPYPLTAIDNPTFHEPVIRGPVLGQIAVNDQLFDPTLRVRVGQSDVTRTPAMLPKLGRYEFRVQHPLLDGKWPYTHFGIGSNTSRRLPTLYDFPNGFPDFNSPQAMAYRQAYQNIVSAPFRSDLNVLDNDDEFIAWYGGAPDFHPRLRPPFCSLDSNDVQQRFVEKLAARIDGQPRPSNPRYNPPGVPKNMTNAFLGMYRQQLQILKNMPPPLTAAQQAQIAALQQKIDILEAFLATLN